MARIHRRGLRGTRRPHIAAATPITAPTSGLLPGAACKGVDPDLFFPEVDPDAPEGECAFEFAVRRAKMVCAGCPVRLLCLDGALKRCEPAGIFGGLDADERRQLKEQTAREARRLHRGQAAEAGLGGAA
ncbi:WhiB family transcriptional regulator [Kitasatospora phosalacinea]|uniref:WhiB family transcriptional regulator n=1 Tax=Kitasatospora phosalacinea TaxID=2065 RepID=UPI003669CBA0